MVALFLLLAMALVEYVVNFVDQQVDGFMHLLGFRRAIDVWATKLNMGLGDKFVGMVVLAVTFKLYPDSHDMSLVTERSLHFIQDVGFQRRGEIKMNASHDDFVGVIALVHCFLWLDCVEGPGWSGIPGGWFLW